MNNETLKNFLMQSVLINQKVIQMNNEYFNLNYQIPKSYNPSKGEILSIDGKKYLIGKVNKINEYQTAYEISEVIINEN